MRKRRLLPMSLQFFAGELDALDSILNGGGAQVEDPAATAPTGEEDSEQHTDGDGDGADGTQQQQPPAKPDKQSYAFAEMRAQLNTYRGLLNKVAQATGIEYADEKDLITKLSDDALTKTAATRNVPKELLQRLEQLEQRDLAHTMEQRQSAAAVGFQTLKTKYGLDDDGLLAFAKELDASGRNPFVQDVDIDKEYRTLHFEEIMAKRVQDEVQKALARSSAADKHSSTPNRQQGAQQSGTPEKVNTVTSLNALLDGK